MCNDYLMQPTDKTSIQPRAVALVLNRSRLNELRKANGIETEKDLARVIGVNYTTLYRVSIGSTIPSNEFMAKVAMAFPLVPFDQLFTVIRYAA